MNRIERSLTIFCLTLIIGSYIGACMFTTDYRHDYEVVVYYTNGDKEVLKFSESTFNGNELKVGLQSYDDGQCLVTVCGAYWDKKACDVRRFQVLKYTSTKIN